VVQPLSKSSQHNDLFFVIKRQQTNITKQNIPNYITPLLQQVQTTNLSSNFLNLDVFLQSFHWQMHFWLTLYEFNIPTKTNCLPYHVGIFNTFVLLFKRVTSHLVDIICAFHLFGLCSYLSSKNCPNKS